MEKRLFRSKDKALGGVCGGIAEYFNVDMSIVRILVLLIAITTGFGTFLIIYIVCWAIIPDCDKNPMCGTIGGKEETNGT